MDRKLSLSPPWGFTPPINFTAGTLNFIGNVNLVVKNTDAHTRTTARGSCEQTKGHPELRKDSRKYILKKNRGGEDCFGRNILFGEREISHQLGWDKTPPKI